MTNDTTTTTSPAAPAAAPDTKICQGCKQALPRSEFWKNRATSDGLQGRCKGCLKSYAPRQRAADKYNQRHARPVIGGRRVRVARPVKADADA